MSRLVPALALFVCFAFGAACDDDDSPTSPGNTVTLTATLSPANEVPPVTNADASASGMVTVTLNLTRNSAGTITAATADFNASVTGFSPTTTITGAHIHSGAAGVAGSVVVDTGITSGQVTLSAGAGSFTRNGISVTPDVAQNLINSTSSFYFNVHTALTPTGAVRGQLSRQ